MWALRLPICRRAKTALRLEDKSGRRCWTFPETRLPKASPERWMENWNPIACWELEGFSEILNSIFTSEATVSTLSSILEARHMDWCELMLCWLYSLQIGRRWLLFSSLNWKLLYLQSWTTLLNAPDSRGMVAVSITGLYWTTTTTKKLYWTVSISVLQSRLERFFKKKEFSGSRVT